MKDQAAFTPDATGKVAGVDLGTGALFAKDDEQSLADPSSSA
jgi:hypothetical protein